MVLYKHKKVEFEAPPSHLTTSYSAEVWEIPQTGEVYTSYESYLIRRDLYHQKKFTCEVTGRHNLTFYEAFDSERNNSREIDNAFPEPLLAPVLRKVQFSTISRLEQLISWVYDEFKSDFWPREHVIATVESGEKIESTVREKISFPPRRNSDGTIQTPAMSKYIVALDIEPSNRRDPEALVDSQSLYRDRRVFSKVLLRQFLKNSLTKESWHGAPWIVKEELAREFVLPTEIPEHLKHDAVMEQNRLQKQQAAEKKAMEAADNSTNFLAYYNSKQPLEMDPQKGGSKSAHRFIQQDLSRFGVTINQIPTSQFQQMQQNHTVMQMNSQGHLQVMQHQFVPPARVVPLHNFHSNQFQPISTVPFPGVSQMLPMHPPLPPPMKFPTEDLDVPLRKDAPPRPTLKFFSEETTSGELQEDCPNRGIHMKSVGPLLASWDSLNVLAEVFILDSFTVDDFAEAMRFSHQEVVCELLEEVHCAVLKQIVDENGLIKPLKMPSFDESEDDTSEGASPQPSETSPTPEPTPPRRTTRSSLRKDELARVPTPTPEPEQIHRAAEMLAERPWLQRLKERDFKNGGWQTILVGILHQLSLDENRKEECEKILAVLAPMDQDATEEVARFQYNVLEPNLRIQALEMILMLAISTPAIREHLEKMGQSMTDLRKKKMTQQKLRKELVEDMHKLDDTRKSLQNEITATQPTLQLDEQDTVAALVKNIEMPDGPEVNGRNAESSENSDDEQPRALRRGMDRKRKREENAVKKGIAKKQKVALRKLSKAEHKLKKAVEGIEAKRQEILDCEEEIEDITSELRETDCQRTKWLGRDRFCNRYVWFERNGMPFGGVPNTSTAHYGYANGRLWVQGPDPIEVDGLIDRPQEEQDDYQEAFGVTVPERKELEEGSTHLIDATQWGYIDDAASVDQLMGWLDERGSREKALRKQIGEWRDMIVECMKKMRSHLDQREAKKAAVDEGEQNGAIRVSTRTKSHVDIELTKWPCLAWSNSIALDQLGSLHSTGIEKVEKKTRGKKGTAEVKSKASFGKTAKASTKQGNTKAR